MTYNNFLKVFGNERVIDIRNVEVFFGGIDRRRLYEWQKRGLIRKLVSNFYAIAGKPVDDQGLRTIACQIYAPSYVGLESALSWYGFIPEAVFQTTCVTARRNRSIRTAAGDFRYRKIAPRLFFGTNVVSRGADHFFISDPEKTLLDHFYFSPRSDDRQALEGMRLNADAIRRTVDMEKIERYLDIFLSRKLKKAVRILGEIIRA